jgi:hypothetical protein
MIKNVYVILFNGYQQKEETLLTDNTLYGTHMLFLIFLLVPSNFVTHRGN